MSHVVVCDGLDDDIPIDAIIADLETFLHGGRLLGRTEESANTSCDQKKGFLRRRLSRRTLLSQWYVLIFVVFCLVL